MKDPERGPGSGAPAGLTERRPVRRARRPIEVAPSILAADFARLGEQVETVLSAGAAAIHVDVMDGHFVPPITVGPLVVAALRELVGARGALLDVHLMVERPERQVQAFAQAGAQRITVHPEATPHLHFALQAIRDCGCAAGVALCPATPPEAVTEVLELVDLVLCMTVNPGWGGQAFLPGSERRLRRLGGVLPEGVALGVDGGIEPGTAARCALAGATFFVAGTAVFGAPDPAAAVRAIGAAAAPGA